MCLCLCKCTFVRFFSTQDVRQHSIAAVQEDKYTTPYCTLISTALVKLGISHQYGRKKNLKSYANRILVRVPKYCHK